MQHRRLLIGLIVVIQAATASNVCRAADQAPTSTELLASFEQSVSRYAVVKMDVVQKIYEPLNGDEHPPKFVVNTTIFRDEEIWKIRSEHHRRQNESDSAERNAATLITEYVLAEQPLYVQLSQGDQSRPLRQRLIVSSYLNEDRAKLRAKQELIHLGIVFGIGAYHDGASIFKILREANELKVDPKSVKNDDATTFVMSGKNEDYGDYALWLDPEYGCLPRRIRIERNREQLKRASQQITALKATNSGNSKTNRNATATSERISVVESYNHFKLAKIAGVDAIAGYEYLETTRFAEGDPTVIRRVFQIEMDFDRSKWPGDAFQNTVVDIPEGHQITALDANEIRLIWKDGKVRPRP